MGRLGIFLCAGVLVGCTKQSTGLASRLNDADFKGLDRAEFVTELGKYGRFMPVRPPQNSRYWAYRDWVTENSDCFQMDMEPSAFVSDVLSICVKRGPVIEEWMTELNFYRGESLIAYNPSTRGSL